MKRAIAKLALAIALGLSGACGVMPSSNGALDIRNGSPAVSIDTIDAVIAYTDTLTPDGSPIDLHGYTLTVWDTVADAQRACIAVDGVACTVIGDSHTIDTPWPSEYGSYDTATLDAISAAALAHELGHVYYFETTGDSDAAHTHTEWFDVNDPSTVCGRVYDAFNN